MPSNNKILLHVCCGPCASGCIPRLLDENYEPTLFFSNSNIDTREEFDRRLEAARKLAAVHHLPLIADEYRHDLWLEAVKGFESEPERGKRCCRCFAFSFARSAAKAAELGMEFTTTLTVSPYKNSEIIRTEGCVFDNFHFFNFKKKDGFSLSLSESAKYGLFRQSYCGCEFGRRTAETKNASSADSQPETGLEARQ